MNGKQARALRKLAKYNTSTPAELKGKAHGVRKKIVNTNLVMNGQSKAVSGYFKYQAITITNLTKQNYKIAKKVYRNLRKTWEA